MTIIIPYYMLHIQRNWHSAVVL